MLVGVHRVKPGRAEITKVRIAPEADHVVTAMRLLSRRGTCWAWRRVQLHVLERCLFLGRELGGGTSWIAANELAVPRLFAATTEGEAAVFTDGEKLLGSFKGLGLAACWRGSVLVV